MYYIYGQSGPSLLIESTDSMIIEQQETKSVTIIYSLVRPLISTSIWNGYLYSSTSDSELPEIGTQYDKWPLVKEYCPRSYK